MNDPSHTFTLNAPTNQAFDALLYKLDMTERELLSDKKLLIKVWKGYTTMGKLGFDEGPK